MNRRAFLFGIAATLIPRVVRVNSLPQLDTSRYIQKSIYMGNPGLGKSEYDRAMAFYIQQAINDMRNHMDETLIRSVQIKNV